MSKVLNKKILAEEVSLKFDITKKAAAEIIDAFLDEITITLKEGGKVELSGFGKFEVRERPARTGINPATKEPMQIAASKAPAFKAAKALKDAVK